MSDTLETPLHLLPHAFEVTLHLSHEEKVTIAAWPFFPAGPTFASPWLLCLPGGTYTGLAYYDCHLSGEAPDTYSMARFLQAQGIGCLVIDNLGTGASRGATHGSELSHQVIGEAYAQLVDQVRAGLATGRPLAGVDPGEAQAVWLGGVGHSMGGFLLTQTEGEHHCFDAVAMLGWTPGPFRDMPGVEPASMARAVRADESGHLSLTDRSLLRSFFYSREVPTRLIAEDEARATSVPVALYTVIQGEEVVKAQAEKISCPVFLGFGAALDVSPDPEAERSFYPRAASVTLSLQPGAHHCATFSASRREGWAALSAWVFEQFAQWTRQRQAAQTPPAQRIG